MSWKDNVSKMSKIKNWDGKLYKVLRGNKSCHGGDFEWSLPEGDKPGDWTPIIEDAKMCESGYHLTTHYAHWSNGNDVSIYEAEGDIVEFDGFDKVVCSRARLLKRIENPFNENNIGDNNSGCYNTGNCNSGNYNPGDWNSGDYNTGDGNLGDKNSGNNNSGNYNVGDFNSGNKNSGWCNSGSYNVGDFNSGNWNSGYKNSGNNNSGNYNSGNNNSGYFCEKSPQIMLFDKPSPKDWEPKFPKWMNFPLLQEGYYKSWQKAFKNSDIEGIKELLALPNFDYEIFERITSITKKQIEEKIRE